MLIRYGSAVCLNSKIGRIDDEEGIPVSSTRRHVVPLSKKTNSCSRCGASACRFCFVLWGYMGRRHAVSFCGARRHIPLLDSPPEQPQQDGIGSFERDDAHSCGNIRWTFARSEIWLTKTLVCAGGADACCFLHKGTCL